VGEHETWFWWWRAQLQGLKLGVSHFKTPHFSLGIPLASEPFLDNPLAQAVSGVETSVDTLNFSTVFGLI
jgi:hypothetical protein